MFNSWGIVNAYGTYSSFYNQHLLPEATLLELNLIGATQCAVILSMAFIMGRFLDAGYYRSVIRTGATLVLISVFLLSVVTGDGGYDQGIYWAIWLLQGFVGAVGFGCFFIASSQSKSFLVRRHIISKSNTLHSRGNMVRQEEELCNRLCCIWRQYCRLCLPFDPQLPHSQVWL